VSELVRRVEKFIEHHRLVADGEAVLVAVSGGVDSMVLLHVLHELNNKHRLKLIVAHFNHLLRGKESDGDERFVAHAAVKLGLPFESARGDVKQFARQRNLSIEMAARALRHEFFARTAARLNVRHIALAHHGDDQLELFFVRLFRGAGTEGLAGMKWSAPSPWDWDITLVRPLLAETKSDLIAFARAKKIRSREDRTNRSTDILRNRIRRKLLPRLRREFQPNLHRTVLRAMDLLRGEAEFVNATAGAWLKKRRREPFESIPVAVQRSVIQSELLRLGVAPQFEWVEQLRATPRWVTLASGFVCRRTPTGTLEKRELKLPEFQTSERLVLFGSRQGKAVFDARRFRWRLISGAKLPARRTPGTEFFDASSVGDRILLRHWKPGDRFQPIGMSSATKLQDLFVNQKIPRERRRHLVVATTHREEIFWVEGLRIGERFKITGKTRETLRWQWEPAP